MSKRTAIVWSATALTMWLALSEPAAAWFPGFPPMPSTCAQWWGYGYGPGHHAPMVKSRGLAPERGPRYVKIDAECLGYPAPYAPIGCYGNGCGCGATGAAGYLPGAGPMAYPQPAMAPTPASAQRDDSHTWR